MTYFHEEQRFRSWWLWALLAVAVIPIAFVLVERVVREVPIVPSLIAIAIFVPVVLLFYAARLVVDVDRDEIRVSFHFLWPTRRIRIADVRRARAASYNPLLYGGWGVHYSWNGWLFNTSGHVGVLVETNDSGRVMIGSQRAEELEAAIARAVSERGRR